MDMVDSQSHTHETRRRVDVRHLRYLIAMAITSYTDDNSLHQAGAGIVPSSLRTSTFKLYLRKDRHQTNQNSQLRREERETTHHLDQWRFAQRTIPLWAYRSVLAMNELAAVFRNPQTQMRQSRSSILKRMTTTKARREDTSARVRGIKFKVV